MERRSESGGGSRRRLLLAGAGGVTGLALGACGTAGGGDGGPAPGALPVTLEFQHRWEGARTEVVDRVVALYQQARPQVRVNSQLVFGNGEG
ncbi:MAG TPA: hypothetical protein VH257_09275, partial [Chloroflexota bacterium]|nr:hypothetical protein [Chloroflexota bacterium]